MKEKLSRFKQFLLYDYFLGVFIICLVLALFIYTRYFTNLTFGDEYDNFVYSWLFAKGHFPYRDFFTHHFPTLIFLGLPLEFIGHSKIIYRYLILIITFGCFSFFSFYFLGFLRVAALVFMVFASFAISLYGGQQFSDGTFWAILILCGFLIVLKSLERPFSKIELLIFTFFSFITFLSSPMHLLSFALLLIFHLASQKRENLKKITQNLLLMSSIFIGGICLFVIFLLKSNSFESFWGATIIFNRDYFYSRVYHQALKIQTIDFYLHTSYDVLNHFRNLVRYEGLELVKFLKASKFIFLPFNHVSYFGYTKVIFSDLYNNFFSFEMSIAIFYLLGIFALILKRQFRIAFFIVIFIFSLRLRLLERIHMAPYYLFSFWLVSVAITIFFQRIVMRRNLIMSIPLFLGTLCLVIIFTLKNWYDFNQFAFNRFPDKNDAAVNFITKLTDKNDKIIVLTGDSASYFYDSRRLPWGRFVNYFEWYDWSPSLKSEWLSDLKNFDGEFLILSRELWEKYNKNELKGDKWLEPSFEIVRNQYSQLEVDTGEAVLFKKISNGL